ncbi:MAG: F0F1 ATP synthase subunit A [Lachnospiraceae bacterium]|nr:F0F1 ATP synthase subunit A [Lachnospiraceae bacterium]
MVQEFKTFWTSREADFSIQYLTDFELFGQKLSITTTHVCTIIVTALLILLAVLANKCVKKAKEIPGYFQNFLELIVDMLDNMVENTMGKNSRRFVNYISSIFLFILLSNISGIFGLRPPTADYGVTLPLGLITFALVHYNGVKKNKAGHFKAMFKPILLSPINIIGEIAVPLSLSLRLFGNVLSGTVLMGLLYGLVPVLVRLGVPAVLHVYFDLFSGAIQTYVFCMLTMVYVNDKIAD